jgi:UDP-glucose 4-epimerase
MRVLVTGGDGFIGRHLVEALAVSREVTSVVVTSRKYLKRRAAAEAAGGKQLLRVGWDACMSSQKETGELLQTYWPAAVFHLAAISSASAGAGPDVTEVNVLGTHKLLEAAPMGCAFVLASSASVYGESFNNQRYCGEEDRVRPRSAYAASKLAAEELALAYGRLGLVRPLCCRLTAQVGPGATHGLLKDIRDNLRVASERLNLIGEYPGTTKPYTHVRDTARFLARLALANHFSGVMNVGNGGGITVHQVASLAMRAAGVSRNIHWLGWGANWAGDDRWVDFSTSKEHLYGWNPEHSTSGDAVEAAFKEMWQCEP